MMDLMKKVMVKNSPRWRNWSFFVIMIMLIPLMIQLSPSDSLEVENEFNIEKSSQYVVANSEFEKSSLQSITQPTSTLTTSDHPLSVNSTRLIGQDEIMTFPWQFDQDYSNMIYQYNGGDPSWFDLFEFTPLGSTRIASDYRSGGNPYWETWRGPFPLLYSIYDDHFAYQGNQILDMQSCDIDDDGRDEIIFLLMEKKKDRDGFGEGSAYLRTYDDKTENYQQLQNLRIRIGTTWTKSRGQHYPDYLRNYLDDLHKIDVLSFEFQDFAGAIALGDPDGDGIANHIGISFTAIDKKNRWNRPVEEVVFFGRWKPTDNWVLYQQLDQDFRDDLGNKYTQRHHSVDCVWGNFDGDPWGKEEFFVTTNIDCRMYTIDSVSDSRINFKQTNNIYKFQDDYPSVPTGKNDVAIREEDPVEVRLVTGDFDGDNTLEIVVYTNYFYYIIESNTDYNSPHYSWTKYRIYNRAGTNIHYMNISPVHLFAIDFNQDGSEEIGFCGITADTCRGYWVCIWKNPTTRNYETLYSRDLGGFWPKWSATGDIDCDGQDEMIINYRGDWIGIWKADASGNMVLWRRLPVAEHIWGPILCGNFDGNGVTLNYTGTVETVTYDPCVLVTMAAPPTQVGITQAYGNSYTSYGLSRTVSSSTSSSVGFNLNSQISFLPDLPVGAFLAATRVWEEAFSETNTKTHTTIVTTYSTGGAQDNTIIYFQGSYKKHIYSITGHPVDQSLIGSTLNISIPDNPSVYTVSQSYFNKYLGEPSNYVPVIGNETFNHTVGHPETYPSRSEITTHVDSEPDLYFLTSTNQERLVGQGNQYDSIVIEISEMEERGFSSEMSSEWGGGGGFLGFGATRSLGETESEGYSISIGDGCVFEGRIGQIEDANEYCLFRYRWGMFIHYKTHPVTNNTYLVINYYVDDAHPYYPSTETSTTSESDTTPFAPEFIVITAFIVFATIKLKKRNIGGK